MIPSMDLRDCVIQGSFFEVKSLLNKLLSENQLKLQLLEKLIEETIQFQEESCGILLLHYATEVMPKKQRLSKASVHTFVKAAIKFRSRNILRFLNMVQENADRDAKESFLKEIEVWEEGMKEDDTYKIFNDAAVSVTEFIFDKKCNTLLHHCAKETDYALPYAYSLLEKKVNAQNKDGDTALHVAARCGTEEMCNCLLQIGCNSMLRNMLGLTAYDVAVQRNHTDIAKLLVANRPGLIYAVTHNDLRATVYALRRWTSLLAIPTSISEQISENSPIGKAIQDMFASLVLVHLVLANDTKGTKRILRSQSEGTKLKINLQHPETGMTPLGAAVRNHNLLLVNELLRHGACPKARVHQRPMAVYSLECDCPFPIVAALLKGGACWEDREPVHGDTPLLKAVRCGRPAEDIRKMLKMCHCLHLKQRTHKGRTVREVARALKCHDIEKVIEEELSHLFSENTKAAKEVLLQMAVCFFEWDNFCLSDSPGPLYEKFIRTLRKIEKQGVDLMTAAEEGNLSVVQALNDAAYVDKNGFTALTRAVVYNQVEVVEWLVAERPHLRKIGDLENRTPLHYAYALPDDIGDELVQLLLERNPEEVEQLTDKDGVIPCNYRAIRDTPRVQDALQKVRTLNPYCATKSE